MKTFWIMLCMLVVLSGFAFAASMSFVKPLPSATQATLGDGQKLEIQKAAIEELRTKMENWAAFTGYSTGTGR